MLVVHSSLWAIIKHRSDIDFPTENCQHRKADNTGQPDLLIWNHRIERWRKWPWNLPFAASCIPRSQSNSYCRASEATCSSPFSVADQTSIRRVLKIATRIAARRLSLCSRTSVQLPGLFMSDGECFHKQPHIFRTDMWCCLHLNLKSLIPQSMIRSASPTNTRL